MFQKRDYAREVGVTANPSFIAAILTNPVSRVSSQTVNDTELHCLFTSLYYDL